MRYMELRRSSWLRVWQAINEKKTGIKQKMCLISVFFIGFFLFRLDFFLHVDELSFVVEEFILQECKFF